MPVAAPVAGLAAGNFFDAPPPPIPFKVLIIVFFAGTFFAAATGFRTTVVPELASLESLIVLARPRPDFGGGAGVAAVVPAVRFPLPAPTVTVEAGSCALRPAVARVDFVRSTIVLSAATAGAAATLVGFSGDTGRARYDFPGAKVGRIGDRDSVCEFADLGERT